jgi:1,4-alpha-glucan branching enzyme
VAVAGNFDGWSPSASPFAAEGGGYWSADVPGAAEGSRYKFVLDGPAGVLWRKDPYAREVASSGGDSIVHTEDFDWGSAAYHTPPWNEPVLYELHVGTFNDDSRDSAGGSGDEPGGFRSVVARLDYLADLGVNAIELMPSMEFATSFSRGYNPFDIFAIERAYGGPTALKALVLAAHEHGVAVIFDVVYNHLGPSDLDLWRFGGLEHRRRRGHLLLPGWPPSDPVGRDPAGQRPPGGPGVPRRQGRALAGKDSTGCAGMPPRSAATSTAGTTPATTSRPAGS